MKDYPTCRVNDATIINNLDPDDVLWNAAAFKSLNYLPSLKSYSATKISLKECSSSEVECLT